MSSAVGINIILRLLIYDPPSSSLTQKIGGEAVPAQCTDTNITMASLCLSQLSTDIQRKLALCNHFLFLILHHIIHKHFAKFCCAALCTILQFKRMQLSLNRKLHPSPESSLLDKVDLAAWLFKINCIRIYKSFQSRFVG